MKSGLRQQYFSPLLHKKKSDLAASISILLVLTLAGCSAITSTPAPAPVPQPAQPRASVYRIASPFDAITLDPAQAGSMEDWWAAGALLFNQLYSFDAQGALQPALARDFPQVSPDGLTLTLPLREGVTFHNGRALTADDVKFTLEHVLMPGTASWGASWLMNIAGADEVAAGASKTLNGVTALGPLALQIKLKAPQAAFPALLAMSAFSIVPRQETLIAGNDWGTRVVVGTGPFKLAEWKKGATLRLERNVGYFKRESPAYDAVELSFNVAAPVAVERWKAGEVDFALLHENAEEWPAVRSDATLSAGLLTGATLAGSRILFNPLNRLTQNLRIRQAIAMAIDPATVFAGSMGATPAMGLLPPESPQFNAGFRNANAYNPERSAALLTEAGYPDVINDLVLFSNERTDEVKTIRDNLQAAGIRTKQIAGDWQQMMDGMRSGEIAIVYVTERMDFNDAFAAVGTPCVATDAPAFQPCNEQVINLLAQAEKLPRASAERTALYQQMQDIIVNQEVSQFVLGWRKSIGLAREGEGAPLHLIFGMPNLEDAPATQP